MILKLEKGIGIKGRLGGGFAWCRVECGPEIVDGLVYNVSILKDCARSAGLLLAGGPVRFDVEETQGVAQDGFIGDSLEFDALFLAQASDKCFVAGVIDVVREKDDLRFLLDDGLHNTVEAFGNTTGEIDLTESVLQNRRVCVRHSKKAKGVTFSVSHDDPQKVGVMIFPRGTT
jgi:hypothetical protein